MRNLRRLVVEILAWLAIGSAVTSANEPLKKVALVVGNSNYAHAVGLPNPANDAGLMSNTLRVAGFTVLEGENLNKAAMGGLIDQFTEAAFDADLALVYYAGHGLQVDGQNYLLPIDAQLEKASQLQTRTISVDSLLSKLPSDPAVSILILDACRDNPLARTFASALPKTRSSAVGNGLAPVQASAQSGASGGGLLIAYATDPGAVAYDGSTGNSPYTRALAKYLTTPGLEIQSALTRVRAEVSSETHGAQKPWHNASLAREVFLGGEPPKLEILSHPSTEVSPASQNDTTWVEQRLWDEASKRNTVAHYKYYLSKFPEGHFAELARINIDQFLNRPASGPDVNTGDSAGIGSRGVPLVAPSPPETDALSELDVNSRRNLQRGLTALGFDVGGVDGKIGPRVRTAIGKWQREKGLEATGYLSENQFLLLMEQAKPLLDHARKSASVSRGAEKRSKAKAKATSTKNQASATPTQPKSDLTNNQVKIRAKKTEASTTPGQTMTNQEKFYCISSFTYDELADLKGSKKCIAYRKSRAR